jgi:hypothetical protein
MLIPWRSKKRHNAETLAAKVVCCQTPTDFHQCQIRLAGDQPQQPVLVSLDRSRAPVAANWPGLPATGLLEALHPTDGGADTDFENRAGTAARRARSHRADNMLS